MKDSLCLSPPLLDKVRCFGEGKPWYAQYHDEEWGVPERRDEKLFELLILEGAQAGLSWETILKRRENYRKAFHGFDPIKVAAMGDEELEDLLKDPGIIRNRRKVESARQNARVFLSIQKERGSFSDYIWGFVGGSPKVRRFSSLKEVPCVSEESLALSKDLKKRGMVFVGPKIMYAFMQAVGLVDDHLATCWKAQKKTDCRNQK